MRAAFRITGPPDTGKGREPRLRIEGLDSGEEAKTRIRVQINGRTVYEGPNPLPNDDESSPEGSWGVWSRPFPASLLRRGANTLTIESLEEGAGRRPWFLLDYAEIRYYERGR
jgi:hypothetical protein